MTAVQAPQPAPTAVDLLNRKLEQTCPRCGRWEAAHRYCSWCQRPMGPADWYFNGDTRERHGRRPAAAPGNPPSEFRRTESWPPEWGECPYRKASPEAASPRQTPDSTAPAPEAVYSATGGTLGLL